MSPEAQRIAIAEACGWNEITHTHIQWENKRTGECALPDGLPDYLNDLNAMHEAEKVLSDDQADLYYQEVCRLGQTMDANPIAEYTIHATAAQRCEAFLRTLNKWEDSK